MNESSNDKALQAEVEETLLREVEGWVHHTGDLQQDMKIHTVELERPIGLKPRLESIKSIAGSVEHLWPSIFSNAEKTLTPRDPHHASSSSFINAFGRSWTLLAGINRLEWAEFGSSDARPGKIELWFRNVVPGTTALVSIYLTVGVAGNAAQGKFEVRSSDAPPRVLLATGFKDHVVDVIVRPSLAYAVLVTLEPIAGVGYLAFRQADYMTL